MTDINDGRHEVAAEAARILEAAAARESRILHLGRRLYLVFHDLGLLDVVGRDWVRPGEESFEFKALDHRTVARFMCRLQEIADGRADVDGRPGPGQIAFDFAPQPVPVEATGSDLHLGGGR